MKNNRDEKAEKFEGGDILFYLEHNMEGINDDELTKGRIRTIYVQLKYGVKRSYEIAEYYDIPVEVVRDIGSGKIFDSITSDL